VKAISQHEGRVLTEEEQITALVRNISALCYQQKKNEATLEEAIILIGELEQAGQAEARENEKKRKQHDTEMAKMHQALKREQALYGIAE